MLLPMLRVLRFYISTSLSTCSVSNKDLFCSSVISCLPVMLIRLLFVYDFELVPFDIIITGISLVVTFHIHCTFNPSSS
jgi:hypothetical protein